MSTTTPNYEFVLPVPNSPIDANTWGTELNTGTFGPLDTYLKQTALNNISNTAPSIPTGAPLAGQTWINTNSSSTTAWFLNVYDGSQWVSIGTINPTAHTYVPAGLSTGVAVQVFSGSGTYTPTSGMTTCMIECWGGGGAGGSCNSGTGGAVGAGGGGAGGYSKTFATAGDIGSSQIVTIGSAGVAASVGANPGGNGSATSVGTLCVANGGTGGGAGTYGSSGGHGGFGGVAGTGTVIAAPGIKGGNGSITFSVAVPAFSGIGGSSTLGSGGAAIISAGSNNGDNSTGNGTGGSGGAVFASNPAVVGGNGGPGYVVITEYL